jgi:hypothetical protein
MFGIFDGIEKSVSNALDVGIGFMTFGEYGDISKDTISRLIADGIELAVIAEALDVSEDFLRDLIEGE